MAGLLSSDEIARDATWLVQAYEPQSQTVRLVRMDPETYRAASFLDDRMLKPDLDIRFVSWGSVLEAANVIERLDARWIFHIGHVGSTLIARLLGELPFVLSIREPRFLRDIAPLDERAELSAAATRLFSRTFGSKQSALVKATSFVSELAPGLLPGNGRALFLYARPAEYIASILAGDASRQELAAYAPSRAERLAQRVPHLAVPHPTDAHAAAAAWACEMTALEHAAISIGNSMWVDFDAALKSLPEVLGDVASFFDFEARPEEVREIISGPLARQYSKALEYDYSADLRRDVIAEATRMYRRDIREALAMLEDAAQESPLLARALSRSKSEA